MSDKPQTAEEQQAHAKARRINRISNWGAMLTAVVLAIVSYFLLKDSPPPYDLEQAKKNAQLTQTVTLSAFQKGADDKLKELSAPPKAGDVIGFKLATARPVHVTLAFSVNDQLPSVLSEDARIPPGPARLVAKQDTLLTYTVLPTDKTLRFCVIDSDDAERLAKRTAGLRVLWPTLPASNCVQVK